MLISPIELDACVGKVSSCALSQMEWRHPLSFQATSMRAARIAAGYAGCCLALRLRLWARPRPRSVAARSAIAVRERAGVTKGFEREHDGRAHCRGGVEGITTAPHRAAQQKSRKREHHDHDHPKGGRAHLDRDLGGARRRGSCRPRDRRCRDRSARETLKLPAPEPAHGVSPMRRSASEIRGAGAFA